MSLLMGSTLHHTDLELSINGVPVSMKTVFKVFSSRVSSPSPRWDDHYRPLHCAVSEWGNQTVKVLDVVRARSNGLRIPFLHQLLWRFNS